jgi:PAS domain S-box-containing protein
LKTTPHPQAARPGPSRELAKVRAQLAEAQATLHAIRSGEVDTVVVAGRRGPQVFTLAGAEHAYRVLIESMNEGALTLTDKGTILYANQCFARMVKRPLEQVLGTSFYRLLSAADQAALRKLLKRTAQAGSKIQTVLHAGDGSHMSALISLRPLGRQGGHRATIGMVVTDMTETRRTEVLLRALTHRVVQVQEAERGRVALELHDHITQLLCAILVRSQVLVDKLSKRGGTLQKEAVQLREMLGQAAEEVERISRNLRPSILDQLGLVAVLRDTSQEFAARTGVAVEVACVTLLARLPADTELTLYRILQEALKNVERYARARHVTVCLTRMGDCIALAVKDDGIGFDPARDPAKRSGKSGLGLLGMRERANMVGGQVTVASVPGHGTTILAQLPFNVDTKETTHP